MTPESRVGGPLALLRDGDLIELDVEARGINLLVSEAELAQRSATWQGPQPRFTRGYGMRYLKHIQQADTGCDFAFLETGKDRDSAGGELEIHSRARWRPYLVRVGTRAGRVVLFRTESGRSRKPCNA